MMYYITLALNVEIQGNVRRFNSVVNNNEIDFNVVSSNDEVASVVSAYWNDLYEVIDNNIEQGRRFMIEVKIGTVIVGNDIEQIKSNLKPICTTTSKYFDIVECKIADFPYFKAL